MRRKLGILSVLLLVAVCGGCRTLQFWENTGNMFRTWDRDLAKIEETTFRHLFNFDPEDPYL